MKKSSTSTFYYFAYGSCMCPVDLTRTMGENTSNYVLGTAILSGYRIAFNRFSRNRQCGVLDIVPDHNYHVEGVLYNLPWHLSDRLDIREAVPQKGYRRETITVESNGKIYQNVRTYVVVNKLSQEIAPNDLYFDTVLRGAITSGLSQEYCWRLFHHMYNLQKGRELILD
jgi:cation transport regulator ChaC